MPEVEEKIKELGSSALPGGFIPFPINMNGLNDDWLLDVNMEMCSSLKSNFETELESAKSMKSIV